MDKQKIDTRLKELEEELLLLSGHLGETVAGSLKDTLSGLDTQLAALAKEVKGGIGQSAGDQKSLAKDLAETAGKLGAIGSALDTIGSALGIQNGKPPKTALPQQVEQASQQVSQQVSKQVSDTVKADIASTAKSLDTRIGEATGTIADSISKQAADDRKSHDELAALVAGLKERIDEVSALIAKGDIGGIGARIEGMEKSVTGAASSLSDLPKQLEKQSGALSKSVSGALEKSATDREEIKNTLMRDHDELHRSLEIIRRMCTTDEEKYLGSVVSLLHERLAALPEAIEALKQKQGVLDKNIQIASQNNMAKQDEIKKVLLYDIGTIIETTGGIREMCDTGEDVPLGSHVSAMAAQTDRLAADVPDILEHVSAIDSRMEGLVAQVRLMRWFVLGAVGMSLLVLGLSFIR